MARMPTRVIAQIHTTSDGLEELFWEWILRVDGQVARRLTAVGGRRERNPWMDVAQLPARDLQALRWNHPRAQAVLESLARQRGHQPSQMRGQLPTGGLPVVWAGAGPSAQRAPGPDADRTGHWGVRAGRIPTRTDMANAPAQQPARGGQAGAPEVPSSSIRPLRRKTLRADGWGRRKITGHTASRA